MILVDLKFFDGGEGEDISFYSSDVDFVKMLDDRRWRYANDSMNGDALLELLSVRVTEQKDGAIFELFKWSN